MREVGKFFEAGNEVELHRDGNKVHAIRKAGERLPRGMREKVVDHTYNKRVHSQRKAFFL